MDKQIQLRQLHERHPGLTKALGDVYSEAAAVSFGRHHTPPLTLTVRCGDRSCSRSTDFESPSPQQQNAHANEIDTTELGAYGVSLAAIEVEENLVAVKRAETLTGADWYVAEAGHNVTDLENCTRLEVSGTDAGGAKDIERRLKSKILQAKRGESNLPAIASVVGFQQGVIVIQRVEQEQ